MSGLTAPLLPFPRAEVSSSSSSAPPGQAGRQISAQVLLHSQGLQASREEEQQDCEVPSSQEDLFDAERTGEFVLNVEEYGS